MSVPANVLLKREIDRLRGQIDAVLALPEEAQAYGGPGSADWESGYESGWSAAIEQVRRALGVTE